MEGCYGFPVASQSWALLQLGDLGPSFGFQMEGGVNGVLEAGEGGSWLLGSVCTLLLYHVPAHKEKNVSPTQNLWTKS